MALDPKELARKKIQDAIKDVKDRDQKADTIVWTAVTVNAGMGAVPIGINIWTFLGVASVMVVFLGSTYGHQLTHEGAAKIIKMIFASVGAMYFAIGLGLKFFAEVLKGVGIITMGGATVAGMALDAVLSGAATYAVGFTTKEYFKKNRQMSKDEIGAFFKKSFEEGKSHVKNRSAATA